MLLRARRRFLRAVTLGLTLASSTTAHAAGLYFADRGVRPLARAGAFVAGADDVGAIAYNPAGLYDAGTQVLIDASWVDFNSDYTRQSIVQQVDPNTGQPVGSFVQTFPTVHGTTPVLPIPTMGASFQVHRKVVLAVGAWAPYAALTTYPDTVNGQPAPQRYSLITLNGSALVVVGADVAYAPSKEWRFGAGIQMLTGKFVSTVDFSGCVPDRFVCATEQPSWDVLAQLSAGPIFAPTGQAGVIWAPTKSWRVGAAFQGPFFVRTNATIDTRLPSTPVFDRASQQGNQAEVAFNLPWTLHAGVEMRAVTNLKLELGGGFERWSMHDKISITPKGVALTNVAGFPPTYNLPEVDLPRNFRDSASVRLGGEYRVDVGNVAIEPRGGVSYESSAVPPAYLSVLTIDAGKVTTALGAGLHVGKWRFDVTYAHVFAITTTVDPATARISQVSPVVANAPAQPNYINGGIYAARADILGVGFAYTFATPPVAHEAPEPTSPLPPPSTEPTNVGAQGLASSSLSVPCGRCALAAPTARPVSDLIDGDQGSTRPHSGRSPR